MMLARTLVAIALLVAAAPARADDAAAQEIYLRGVRYFNLQQYEDALDAFQSIYTVERPQLLFNIAQCQRLLQRWEAAKRSYQAFLASAPPSADRSAAERYAAEMDARAQAPASAPPVVAAPPPSMSSPPENYAEKVMPPPDRLRLLRLTGIALTGAGAGLVAAGGVCAGLSTQAGNEAWHRDVYDYDADVRRQQFRAAAIATFVVGGAAVIAGVSLWAVGARR